MNIKLLEVSGKVAALKAVSKPYKNDRADIKLLKKVTKVLKHESLLEMIVLHWEIDGVSRAELQEHMRHRMSSATVESSRYTLTKMIKEFDMLDDCGVGKPLDGIPFDYGQYFVYPGIEHFRNQEDFINFKQQLELLNKKSIELMREWEQRGYSADLYKYMLVENKKTSFVWKIDLRNFLNFLHLRTDHHAHFEIKEVANKMREIAEQDDFLKELL